MKNGNGNRDRDGGELVSEVICYSTGLSLDPTEWKGENSSHVESILTAGIRIGIFFFHHVNV